MAERQRRRRGSASRRRSVVALHPRRRRRLLQCRDSAAAAARHSVRAEMPCAPSSSLAPLVVAARNCLAFLCAPPLLCTLCEKSRNELLCCDGHDEADDNSAQFCALHVRARAGHPSAASPARGWPAPESSELFLRQLGATFRLASRSSTTQLPAAAVAWLAPVHKI